MQAITIADINKSLSLLPEDKLGVVYDVISYLVAQVKPEPEKSRSTILISLDEYERLKRVSEQKSAFYDLSRNLGRDVEKQGITEKEFLAGIKQTRQEVFEKQYGKIS